MAAPSTRQWGVTPPISGHLPTEAEITTNDALIAELKRQNNFESSEETEKRYVGCSSRRAYTERIRGFVQEERTPVDPEG